jgi:hypothetical protein
VPAERKQQSRKPQRKHGKKSGRQQKENPASKFAVLTEEDARGNMSRRENSAAVTEIRTPGKIFSVVTGFCARGWQSQTELKIWQTAASNRKLGRFHPLRGMKSDSRNEPKTMATN